ncbi:MAG: hypothetical protein ACRC1T_08905 [Clostridium chrysemydis]|uniref:hypothetical protein n=1 Tax=Clostridium chrysemydis TaxID=2665504 RepID=UPI003F2A3E30
MWEKTIVKKEFIARIPIGNGEFEKCGGCDIIKTYRNKRLKIVIEEKRIKDILSHYTHYVEVDMANGNVSTDYLAKYTFKDENHIKEILDFYEIEV